MKCVWSSSESSSSDAVFCFFDGPAISSSGAGSSRAGSFSGTIRFLFAKWWEAWGCVLTGSLKSSGVGWRLLWCTAPSVLHCTSSQKASGSSARWARVLVYSFWLLSNFPTRHRNFHFKLPDLSSPFSYNMQNRRSECLNKIREQLSGASETLWPRPYNFLSILNIHENHCRAYKGCTIVTSSSDALRRYIWYYPRLDITAKCSVTRMLPVP